MTSDRGLFTECLKMAVELCQPNRTPSDIIKCARELYDAIPREAERARRGGSKTEETRP